MRIGDTKAGFTLIELLIATSIMTMTLVGMASVTVVVIKGNTFSKDMSTAATLVNDKLEDLKSKLFTAADLASGAHEDAQNPINALFFRTWDVSDTLDAAHTKVVMKTITVIVRWSWGGRTHDVTVKTIIANPS